MRCPFCNADKDKVVDSRSADQGRTIRRRRECLACTKRFTTYERVDEAPRLMVVKKDGTRVPYDRVKLMTGLERACYKRPVAADVLQSLIEQFEDELFRTYDREVESHVIGRMISDRLKAIDQVAYVRYASVYKQFKDLDDLLDEVREVMETRQPPDPPEQGRLF